MKKISKWSISILAAFFVMLLASPASAHVTVQPSESQTGAYEKYTVRVPVEKESNTTELTLEVPNGVTLVSVLPMDNWDYKLNKNKDGIVISVVWTAKKGGIGPNEFEEFSFIGANPDKAGEVSWKALQKYNDNSVVKWVGAPDAEEPASVTKIAKGEAAADHGHASTEAKTESDKTESNTMNWLPIALSAIALIVAVIGLFRKRTA